MLEPTAGLFNIEARPRISARALIRTANLLDALIENNDLSRLATARAGRSSHGSTHALDKQTGISAGSNTEHKQTRPVAQNGTATVGGGSRAITRKRKKD